MSSRKHFRDEIVDKLTPPLAYNLENKFGIPYERLTYNYFFSKYLGYEVDVEKQGGNIQTIYSAYIIGKDDMFNNKSQRRIYREVSDERISKIKYSIKIYVIGKGFVSSIRGESIEGYFMNYER